VHDAGHGWSAAPATVAEAKPPMPLVTSHSRTSAVARSVHVSGSKRIAPCTGVNPVFALAELEAEPCRWFLSLRGAAISGSFTALLEQFCYQAGPACLMIRADAGAVVAVEVFVKQNEVAPVRIAMEKFQTARGWTPSIFAAHKNTTEAPGKFAGDLPKIRLRFGTRRAGNSEVFAIIVMKLLQRFDQ